MTPSKLTERLAELKKIAEAAGANTSHGYWYKDGNDIRSDYDPYCTESGISDCTAKVVGGYDFSPEDLEHIAAFNPAQVHRLIRALEIAVKALDKVSKVAYRNEYDKKGNFIRAMYAEDFGEEAIAAIEKELL